MKDSMKHISIMGVSISLLSLDELIQSLSSIIATRKKAVVSYVNIHALNLAFKNQSLKNFFNNSDIVFCDGFGVRIGARIMGEESPERFTPPDWIGRLFEICVNNKVKIFFLGAYPGIAEHAAMISTMKYPGLEVCGTHHGYFDKSKNSLENKLLIKKINELSPEVILVGFGMPSQEYWIEENKSDLNASLFIPVGALFDYLSGKIYRVPLWMTDHGLEWLGRLIVEPRRLWKRYILGLPLFFFRVFKELINKKRKK